MQLVRKQRLVFGLDPHRMNAPVRSDWFFKKEQYGGILCASSSKPNGFPENNPELEKEIQNYYDSLPDLTYELHTGQVENVLKVLNGEEELLLDGMSGKAALELIMGIYSSSVSGRAVELPLSADNPFYSKESALKAAPHFYEKNASIEKLPDEYK